MTQDHGTVKKLPYLEGDWVAVPLRGEAGWGVGRISRMAPRGRALVGYFFGDRFPTLPTLRQVSHLKPDQAVLIRRFGDLGLIIMLNALREKHGCFLQLPACLSCQMTVLHCQV